MVIIKGYRVNEKRKPAEIISKETAKVKAQIKVKEKKGEITQLDGKANLYHHIKT